MPFRPNTTLVTRAATVAVTANNSADVFVEAAAGATAFLVANGNVGDDTFLGFTNDDSVITNKVIFDGNGDGFIAFGPNGVLDVDRTGGGAANAGPDQLQLVGTGDDAITELRFLGSKSGGNQFVYADATTLRNLATAFGDGNLQDENGVVEGTVGNNTIDASVGATVILQDNALGLNLGGDTINGFGDDDLLVTTELLFDSDANGTIEFSSNLVLDVSAGDLGPQTNDPSQGPGGQLDFGARQSVEFLGSNVINGVTYYYYGTEGSTFDPSGAD